MRLTNLLLMAALGAVLLTSAGCANGGSISSIFTSLTTQTPAQITTLADAEQAATLVAQGADFAVNHTTMSAATKAQLKKDAHAISTALDDLDADQAAGRSLTFGAFQAALDAYNGFIADNKISTH